MRKAQWTIVGNFPGEPLVIRDVGHDCISITNDVEGVLIQLHLMGLIENGRRLFYYDSTGELDEILHKDGEFIGFKYGGES